MLGLLQFISVIIMAHDIEDTVLHNIPRAGQENADEQTGL